MKKAKEQRPPPRSTTPVAILLTERVPRRCICI